MEREHRALRVEPVLNEDCFLGVIVRRPGRRSALWRQHDERALQAVGAVRGRVVVPEVRSCRRTASISQVSSRITEKTTS